VSLGYINLTIVKFFTFFIKKTKKVEKKLLVFTPVRSSYIVSSSPQTSRKTDFLKRKIYL